MATITKTKEDSKVEELLSKPYRLDLHNDDYNTFDHVINCLMKSNLKTYARRCKKRTW